MTMTRQHFEMIAETIRFMNVDEATRGIVAAEFADSLRRTNGAFDRERFLRAALPERVASKIR